mgnify:CR=1 FL=1
MVSKYLDQTRSLEELDALIESDRQAAASLAVSIFSQQVAMAIHNIGECNILASARIRADSMVTSAKLTSDAEICAAQLTANTEIAVVEIEKFITSSGKNLDVIAACVSEMGNSAISDISLNAANAVEVIKRQAELAIQQITENAKASIDEIKGFAVDVAAAIDVSATETKTKLDLAKLLPRTRQSVALNAEDAANRVHEAAISASEDLTTRVEKAIEAINTAVGESIKLIVEIASNAEIRICDTRDAAILRIQEFLRAKMR